MYASDKATRHSLTFIFITVLIDVTGLGIVLPVMPDLMSELTGLRAADASIYGGIFLFVYAFTQFLAAPVLGNLSDRFGRRPVLLLALLGLGLDYIAMSLAPTLTLLLIARFFAGIVGASHTTAMAFIADVSPPEKRSENFGLVGAAFGLGFIIGPVIGGIAGDFGPRVPFYAAAALAIANLIYGYFVLPESLPPDKRRPFDWRRANPLGAVMQLSRFPVIMALGAVYFLVQFGNQVYPAIWAYYSKEKFGWSPIEIGVTLAIAGVLTGLFQGILIGRILRLFGEQTTVLVALLIGALGYVTFAVAPGLGVVMIAILAATFAGVSAPALNGIMSRQLPVNEQGELHGAMTGLMSIASFLSPLLMTPLFFVFTRPEGESALPYFPGSPFILAATLNVIAVLPFLYAGRVLRDGGGSQEGGA